MASRPDARHRWMVARLTETFDVPTATAERSLTSAWDAVVALLSGSRDAVVFFHQPNADAAAATTLFAADPGSTHAAGRTLTFLRVTPAGEAVREDAPDVGLAAIELLPENEAGATVFTASTNPPSSLLPAAQALMGNLMMDGGSGAGGAGALASSAHLDILYAPDASVDALIDGALKDATNRLDDSLKAAALHRGAAPLPCSPSTSSPSPSSSPPIYSGFQLAPPNDPILSTADLHPALLARLASVGGPAVGRAKAVLANWNERVHHALFFASAAGSQPPPSKLPTGAAAASAAATAATAAMATLPSTAWPAAEVAWWTARGAALADAEAAVAEPGATKAALAIGSAVALPERARTAALAAEAVAAVADAAGTARCLATLDRSVRAALREGAPAAITPALPDLARDVAMVASLSRHHASPPRAASLAHRVGARVTGALAAWVGRATASPSIWEGSAAAGAGALEAAAKAADAYVEAVRGALAAQAAREAAAAAGEARPALAAAPPPAARTVRIATTFRPTRTPSTLVRRSSFKLQRSGSTASMLGTVSAASAAAAAAANLAPPSPAAALLASDEAALGATRRFATRCRSLAFLLNAAAQFVDLEELTHIPALPALSVRFADLLAQVRSRAPSSLAALDVSTASTFDRDLLEAAVGVHALEGQVLDATDAALEAAPTVENGAVRLRAVDGAARSGHLKSSLRQRWPALLARYIADMDAIKAEYDAGRDDPKGPAGVPRGAGGVLWARALLRRVEAPMARLAAEGALEAASSPDVRRAVAVHNSLATVLTQHEALWTAAWASSAEHALAGLSVPLVVMASTPSSSSSLSLAPGLTDAALAVAADARWMGRLGCLVPPAAASAALQEGRLRSLHTSLARTLCEERPAALAGAPPAVIALLAPRTTALDAELARRGADLTWTSAGAATFVADAAAAVRELAALAESAGAVLSRGVDGALASVGAVPLAPLPTDPVDPATFVATTKAAAAAASSDLAAALATAQQGLADLVDLVSSPPASPLFTSGTTPWHPDPAIVTELYHHAEACFARAVTACLVSSLRAVWARLAPGARPLFSVTLELGARGPAVEPGGAALQAALNVAVAGAVAAATAAARPWPASTLPRPSLPPPNADARVVTVGLALTNAVASAVSAGAAAAAITPFVPLSKLWTVDGTSEANACAKLAVGAVQPFADAFTALAAMADQLTRAGADPHPAGPLLVHAAPLVAALRREAATWRGALAVELRKAAVAELADLVAFSRGAGGRLARKVDDLADARTVASALGELRDREDDALACAARVEAAFVLLDKHGGPALTSSNTAQADLDAAADAVATLHKLRRTAADARDALAGRRSDLEAAVARDAASLCADADALVVDWDAHGPTPAATGSDPKEGAAKVARFTAAADAQAGRWADLASAEALFGLPPTAHVGLATLRAELAALARLYALFTAILDTIRTVSPTPLPDAAAPLSSLADAVAGFAADIRALPKFLRDGWAVFGEVRAAVDELGEVVPLAQALAHPTIRPRHWDELWSVLKGGDGLLGGGGSPSTSSSSSSSPLLAAAASAGLAAVDAAVAASGEATPPSPGSAAAADATTSSPPPPPPAARPPRLGTLLLAGLAAHRDTVDDLASRAGKEAGVEAKLAALAAEWSAATLTFTDHKARGPVVLKPADTADLVERLEDAQVTLGAMASNRYAAPFALTASALLGRLSAVGEVLERWLGVQGAWAYMEAVFAGGDIVAQLPGEAKRFASIDRGFMKVVGHARDVKGVVVACTGSDLLRTLLPHLAEQLEVCQKALAAYLEAKRALFPRFYFVSDPTLLEILSLGSDPAAVAQHFQSGMFDALAAVTFEEGNGGGGAGGGRPASSTLTTTSPPIKTRIVEMVSVQGERVRLEPKALVDASGLMVEAWLARLVAGMQTTVKASLRRAVRAAAAGCAPADLVLQHPSQAALLALQWLWTAETQTALVAASTGDKAAPAKALERADTILRSLIDATLRPDLTRNQRTSLETCITVHMHQKEALEDLVRRKVRDPTDFEWLKQTRIYWRGDGVVVSIADADFDYSYEYLGVKERLVMTALTDRCYITLSQALAMHLGGAPAGPAGTGKTETTKDLGATLGKYVVVFNCSDQMDYKALGKIFKGLAHSGLWGCFDEFNRITLDVLSVCAQQVACVLGAVRARLPSFTFTDGATVPLDPRVGLFITMNPGYAGRVELPENLKALFRGVVMMVPNRQAIIKVKLAACGYQEAGPLARKFAALYGLCEQQLSRQPHYDFGLRNILAVLRTAGASKRAAPPGAREDELVMRSLRDMNTAKLAAEDGPLFAGLLADLFPGLAAPRLPAADVAAALRTVVADRGLQPHGPWLEKAMQLHETVAVRHGVMLVGPSGAGKTAMADCLAAALSATGTRTGTARMNPKSLTAPQMFGRLDAATGDWTDGVFAVLWRRAARARSQATWIVLDGPVDAVWIENLNTVLDDNRVLTLANGDRIPMTSSMKALFECENLNNASPATVSRAGIICVTGSELGWEPVVESWLGGRRPTEAAALRPLFGAVLPKVLAWLSAGAKPLMHNEAVNQVSTLLTLLDGALGRSGGSGGGGGNNPARTSTAGGLLADHASTPSTLERVFLYSIAWGLGGLLESADRVGLDAELRKLSSAMPPDPSTSSSSSSIVTIYDYAVADGGAGWQPWTDRVPVWRVPSSCVPQLANSAPGVPPAPPTPPSSSSDRLDFSSMVVPTVESVRLGALMTLMHAAGKPVLLVGGPGTAKTTIVRQFLAGLVDAASPSTSASAAHAHKTLTFSSLTTPAIFQAAVEACVEKRQGRTYGPPPGRTLTLFLDDLSMPALNEWGDQPTAEAVRQLLDTGGLYSTEKPVGEMKSFVATRIVAAMRLPTGGANDVPNRLKRQFAIFAVPAPSPAVLGEVFGPLVAARFDAALCGSAVAAVASRLVPATVTLASRLAARLLPTPAKVHYRFSMHELAQVFAGLLMASRDRFGSSVVPGQGLAAEPAWPEPIASPEAYVAALWAHECGRVFGDRMVTADDAATVAAETAEIGSAALGSEFTPALTAPVSFVDFLREPARDPETGEIASTRPSAYEAAPSLDALRARCEELQARHCSSSRTAGPPLVLFRDALTHLTRLTRVLAMDRGCAVLVGVGGSGKQSLARLAAALAGVIPFQVTPTRGYGPSNFLDDLKALYRLAGVKGQAVAFILADGDIRDEAFLEYVNQVMGTGDVPGMYSRDELDGLCAEVRPAFLAANPLGTPVSPDALRAFFLARVRARLRILLCLSPVGPALARRVAQFPAIFAGSAIDWFLPWPVDALAAVAGAALERQDLSVTSPAVVAALPHAMASVHARVVDLCAEYRATRRRSVHVTPKSYLAFLDGYAALYTSKLAGIRAAADQVAGGLAKMDQAKRDVGSMREELAAKNADLVKAGVEAAALLARISESTFAAEREKAKVSAIVNAVTAQAASIATVKDGAARDLAAAKPALDAALAALASITPRDISNLKALKNPPDVVRRIFDCVLLLRRFPLARAAWHSIKGAMVIEGDYDSAVRMMGDMTFLSALVNFPKETITDETVELLQPYFAAPDFNYEAAKQASGNVAGLCNWASAMCTYHAVAKKVDPKIRALQAAEADLAAAEAARADAETNLAAVTATLDRMQADFEGAVAHKHTLEGEAAATQARMDAAEALLAALGGEEARWTGQAAEFETATARLAGDCLVAAGFLSYAGPFALDFRARLMEEVLASGCVAGGIPLTPGAPPTSLLVDDAEVGEWTVEGLPTDALPVQNGVLVTRAARCPLLIDPQGQGQAWLANHVASGGGGRQKSSLRTIQPGDKKFRSVLEDCLSSGTPLLIDWRGGDLDPALDPVLERRYIKRGPGRVAVLLGDREVDVSPGFALYLATPDPAPPLTPELCARVTAVDFTVTELGLEDQLLGRLVMAERRDLEERRVALVVESATHRRRLRQLEVDLLARLSAAQGELVDDSALVGVLASTKRAAGEAADRLAVASDTNARIRAACDEFRPAARRGALLYFLVLDFAAVNTMYQTSLAQFCRLYDGAITTAPPSALTAARVGSIANTLTASVHAFIRRGLYETDRPVFSAMLALRVALGSGGVCGVEVDALLRGGGGGGVKGGGAAESAAAYAAAPPTTKRPKDWLPEAAWQEMVGLARVVPALKELPISLVRSEPAWKAWWQCAAPEGVALPDGLDGGEGGAVSTSSASAPCPAPSFGSPALIRPAFLRLAVVRAMREDRTLPALAGLVAAVLGPACADPPPPSLSAAIDEATTATPIICLLSKGSDPTRSIEDLAKRRRVRVSAVSLGQGQEGAARRALAMAAATGGWAVLQNAHLGPAFMPEVEGAVSAPDTLVTLGGGVGGGGQASTSATPPAAAVAQQPRPAPPHPAFRLFITVSPTPSFPPGLLQAGIKVTDDPPTGVRAGLRATFADVVTQDMLDAVPGRAEWRPLLFAAAFMHALLLERRRFGPLGWVVPYDFGREDLAAVLAFLQRHLSGLGPPSSSPPSWDAIRFMASAIHYGGRITADYDQRVMNAYADRCLGVGVLAAGWDLGAGPSTTVAGAAAASRPPPRYAVLAAPDLETTRRAVEGLPALDAPDLFGLHASAELVYRGAQARAVVGAMAGLQPRTSGGSGGAAGGGASASTTASAASAREAAADAAAAALQARLPARFAPADIKAGLARQPGGAASPLAVYLRQEVGRLGSVLASVEADLASLRAAVDGTATLTPALALALEALADGRTPPTWTKLSWEAASLAAWADGAAARSAQLGRWLGGGRPKAVWLPGLANPPGFFTALKQEAARAKAGEGWALDDVSLSLTVTHPPIFEGGPLPENAPAGGGLFISGLWLDGAAWDGKAGRLADPADPRKGGGAPVALPLVHVAAVQASSFSGGGGGGGPTGGPGGPPRPGTYGAPLYRARRREGAALAEVSLKTDGDPVAWTLRGVAVVCNAEAV